MVLGANPSLPALVLGSSAVGAIVGGYITTWLRGRQERDEAMRTRLIEVADEFVSVMTDAFMAYDTRPLVGAIAETHPLRDKDGQIAGDLSDILQRTRELVSKANSVHTRVTLLYGRNDGAHQAGLVALDCLSGSCNLLEGRPSGQETVQLALTASREGLVLNRDDASWSDQAREKELLGANVKVSNLNSSLRRAAALQAVGLPADDFDADVDASVAIWTRALRQAAANQLNRFVDLAATRIHDDHPGDLAHLEAGASRWRGSLRNLRRR